MSIVTDDHSTVLLFLVCGVFSLHKVHIAIQDTLVGLMYHSHHVWMIKRTESKNYIVLLVAVDMTLEWVYSTPNLGRVFDLSLLFLCLTFHIYVRYMYL